MAPAPLGLQVITFNCGRQLVDVQSFSASVFQPYVHPNGSSSSDGNTLLPDLVVLNLQEIAPIAYSFIGGSFLTPYFSQIVRSVQQAGAKHNQHYELVVARNVGMTAIIVLATAALGAHLNVSQVAGVGVGNYGLGNKGAVGVRLDLDSTVGEGQSRSLTFVSAHLAPMEDAYLRRNQDWEQIVRGLGFHSESKREHSEERQPLLSSEGEDGESSSNSPRGMIDSNSVLFFSGDLNYRTSDIPPGEHEHLSFFQPQNLQDEAVTTSADFSKFREPDQLDRERQSGSTLHALSEAPISFPPTYKFSTKAQQTWPKDGKEPTVYHWSTHRFPSWCDRILYTATLDSNKVSKTPLTILSYSALPLQPTSDHRPVSLATKLDLAPPWWDTQLAAKAPFPLKSSWREDRAADRRKELLVGVGALLTTTVEGFGLVLAIVAGSLGGWFLLKAAMAS